MMRRSLAGVREANRHANRDIDLAPGFGFVPVKKRSPFAVPIIRQDKHSGLTGLPDPSVSESGNSGSEQSPETAHAGRLVFVIHSKVRDLLKTYKGQPPCLQTP